MRSKYIYIYSQPLGRLAVIVLVLLATLFAGRTSIGAAAEASATPANPTDEQVLQRWTPGGNTNDLNLPYRHRYAEYERETDANWVDGRWQETHWGPFVTHATEIAGQPLRPKSLILFLNAEKSVSAMFDLEHCGVRVVARVARWEIDPARFGLLRKPNLKGNFQFNITSDSLWSAAANSTASELKPAAVSYRGLRLCDSRVLLEYSVADVPIAETMWLESSAKGSAIVRQLEVGPSERELSYQLNQGSAEQQVTSETEREQVTRRGDIVSIVGLIDAPQGVKLASVAGAVQLRVSPRSTATTVTCVVWQGAADDQPAFDAWRRDFKPTSAIDPLRKPGGRRWGEPLVTAKALATAADQPYVVDDFPIPQDNPYKAMFFCSSLEFFPDGVAAVCTAHGDVWLVRGLHEPEKAVTWQRFATGLFQPLGLKIIDGKIIVLGNDQLTRLHDLNGDGEADWYESFNHDLRTFGQDHAYAMRLEIDAEGRFYFLKSGAPPHGSALYRLSSDGKQLERIATGFRHPFGMGVSPSGEITVADNEGNWVPSSKIDVITPGGFYGYVEGAPPADGSGPLRPLCYLPKVADNASGPQAWATSDRWGDYHRGGMLHFSWGRGTLHAVLEQRVGAVRQAATVEYPQVALSSGPADAAFSPIDGQLYVVGLDGWQTAATRDGCLSRVRYTGQPTRMPTAFEVHQNGILIRFSQPLDAVAATKRESYHASQWNYHWTSTYGSYHYSLAEPDRVGHDAVAVDRVSMLPDGSSVFLHIQDLKPVDQIHVHVNLLTKDGHPLVNDLYGTISALAEPLQTDDDRPEQLFAKENLVAWCIVPFDAENRGPAERVAMLERLGIHRVAYDWRDHHIPQFDEELSLYKQHGIELVGFWTQVNTADPLSDSHVRCVLEALERNAVRTQLWVMLGEHLFEGAPESERVELAAIIVRPLAEKAQQLGCSIGLYNHGGWFGDVDHQIAIIKRLERDAVWNVGIVYNLHHGQHEIARFPALLARMQPYLYAINLNGMKAGGPMILPIGQGDDDGSLLAAIQASGYRGPIGILNHREQVDAEVGLRENLDGLERLTSSAGAK